MSENKTTNLDDLAEDMLRFLIRLYEHQENIKIKYKIRDNEEFKKNEKDK
jgi:hypothetical protein